VILALVGATIVVPGVRQFLQQATLFGAEISRHLEIHHDAQVAAAVAVEMRDALRGVGFSLWRVLAREEWVSLVCRREPTN